MSAPHEKHWIAYADPPWDIGYVKLVEQMKEREKEKKTPKRTVHVLPL